MSRPSLAEKDHVKFLIFIATISIGYLTWKKREESLGRVAFARMMTSVNSCTGKDECAVIYVTPWCPTCKALKPKIQHVLKTGYQDSTLGIRVIVGQGKSESENALEAVDYGASGSTDDGGIFQKQYEITSYPTVLLLDGKQKVLARGQAALNKMLTKAYPGLPVPPVPGGPADGPLAFPQ
jgi:thiol-disulfide isomerase/thioredoxin